jgi:hypothetical protein
VFDAHRRSDRWIEGGERILEREFANGFALEGFEESGIENRSFWPVFALFLRLYGSEHVQRPRGTCRYSLEPRASS